MLTPEQRKTLLTIARESIRSVFEGRRPELDESRYDADLHRLAGAFVTLTEHGDLRGCIGSIMPTAPLYEAVSSSAVNAAFRDPRFDPLDRAELDSIDLEISVMGPITPVKDIGEIEVGRDGLIISRGHSAGLLLPQVATDYGWDRETFLSQTCWKAGLPLDAWKQPGTKIERFSAEVFGEQSTENKDT